MSTTAESTTLSPRKPRESARPPGVRWRTGAKELLLVALLYVGYSAGRLLADDDLRRRCGETLRRRVEAGFTSEASAASYAALYQELLA